MVVERNTVHKALSFTTVQGAHSRLFLRSATHHVALVQLERVLTGQAATSADQGLAEEVCGEASSGQPSAREAGYTETVQV